MLAAACWVALTTSDAKFRGLLLGLGMLGVLSLVSIASLQFVPERSMLTAPILAPPLAFIAHVFLLVPDNGARGARLAWAAANLTFIVRSTIFMGAFV